MPTPFVNEKYTFVHSLRHYSRCIPDEETKFRRFVREQLIAFMINLREIGEQGFAYAYGWNVYYQRILGFCPVNNERVFERHRGWIWAFMLFTFMWIPQTACLLMIRNNLNLTIDCLSTNLATLMCIAKISVLQYQRTVIGSIIASIADDWLDVRTKEEREAMMVTARISRFNSKISFTFACLSFSSLVVSKLSIILGVVEDPGRDPRLAEGFLLESWFPFETSNPIVFVPLWLAQCFSTWLAANTYAGPDCFVSTLVLHLCGQLSIVRLSLKNLANDDNARKPAKFWQNLRAIVKRHDQLNQLTQVIGGIFSTVLLAQIVTCSMTFCFQGYAMFMRTVELNGAPIPIPVLLFQMFWAAVTVEHLFVYCWVGDRLLSESTSIPNDFYSTPWYNLAPKEARSFILVCQRASIPLELRAGKFCTFNLQLFNAIMKNSMGYLSMLMATKERLLD